MRKVHNSNAHTPFRNRFAANLHLVSILCALCVLCGEINAQDFKQVHPGVEYAEVNHKIGDDPVRIDLLRLDLKKVRIDVHHAQDRAIGLETTSSIAKRKKALAAINAGFFRLDNSEFAGDAADILMIDGRLVSEGDRGRVILRIDNTPKGTNAAIRHARMHLWFGSMESRFRIKLAGVNRPRAEKELVAYDAGFGDVLRHSAPATDILLTGCTTKRDRWQNMSYCTDHRIIENSPETRIPPDGYVISTGAAEFPERDLLMRELGFFRNSPVKGKRLFFRVEDPAEPAAIFPADTDIVAGVPQLIRGRRIDITWEKEKASRSFAESRHPRTAVAIMGDGKFLMITVDGRQPGVSVGMSLRELAEYLLSLGAVDAMNLDGGGSTTMVVDGKVVNKPSDKEGERKVGDAIVVTPRRKK